MENIATLPATKLTVFWGVLMKFLIGIIFRKFSTMWEYLKDVSSNEHNYLGIVN